MDLLPLTRCKGEVHKGIKQKQLEACVNLPTILFIVSFRKQSASNLSGKFGKFVISNVEVQCLSYEHNSHVHSFLNHEKRLIICSLFVLALLYYCF